MTFKGYNENVVTMVKNGTVTVGYPVVATADGASDANSNSGFVGVCKSLRDECCGVQTQGYMEVPYSGNAPTYGYVKLVANGSGGVVVKADASVPFVTVLKVDSENKIVGFIL